MREDFNWVEARNNCSAASAFEAMRGDVAADLDVRIKQDPRKKQSLSFAADGPDKFRVSRDGSHEIVFERIGETIKISHAHVAGVIREILTVSVGMNDQGECVLHHGLDELPSWQVRRMALEGTFFPTSS